MFGKTRALTLVLTLSLAAAGAALAKEYRQELKVKKTPAELAQALQKGGYVVLFRHASTGRTLVDDDFVDMADCATQRNLSDHGREQAQQIGAAWKKLGIRADDVRTSPYCRCVETGELAFGKGSVAVDEVLAAQGGLSGAERGAKVRQMLATAPSGPGNTVLISHTAALLYSFGLQSKPEGIAHVFQPNPVGPASYLGMIQADDWPGLAGLAAAATSP